MVTFTLTINYPEINSLQSTISTYELETVGASVSFVLPALPKWQNNDKFLGWKIHSWSGDCGQLLSDRYATLTKNNLITFDTSSLAATDGDSYSIELNLQIAWKNTITYNMSWGSFGSSYKIMTVVIDYTNLDPEAACVYADDAASMTPGAQAWDEWFGYYPVVLDAGTEYKRLNPNNLQQYTDGSSIGTLTNTQDVMIARPKMGWRMITDETNAKLYVSMTDNPNAADFVYYAHFDGISYVDKFYEAVYKASSDGNGVHSWSGQIVLSNISLESIIDLVPQIAISPRYHLRGFYQHLFWQIQYLLKYKNLDSQSAVGMDVVSDTAEFLLTGQADDKGMNWGEQTGTMSVKCLGLENPWGNYCEWLGGLLCNEEGWLKVCKDPNKFSYNLNDPNYENLGIQYPGYQYGYIGIVAGNSEGGFIPVPDTSVDPESENPTPNSPFNADVAACVPGFFPLVGGCPGILGQAGAFVLDVGYPATYACDWLGARFVYI